MALRTRILACSAALGAVILLTVPGGRSFASDLASKIVHLRPGGTTGPIPFILDLHKHKRASKPPAKHVKKAKSQPASSSR